ncbi:hypothetical protein BGX34_007261 [Mortierella sp. NVP85]|nr:hypothetical protein BGX34_007261 [Mortierella sp. NVP85]
MFDIPGLSVIVARLRRLQHSQLLVTVFDLPELNGIIFSYLSRNDLVRWARVSKRWHRAVIPYIWRDMSALTESQYKRLARMVINDYQRVHCHPPKMTGGQQSSLVKYCPLIRKLGLASGQNLICSRSLFQFILMDLLDTMPPDDLVSKAPGIFHSFMTHCTHLHALDLDIPHSRFYESVKVIADSAVQHLQHLSIHGSIFDCAFKYLIARCPTTLETLELSFTPIPSDKRLPVMELGEAGQDPLSRLRRLTLRDCDGLSHEILLSSLWRRCESVEALELMRCYFTFHRLMPAIMETFLPNLNSISIEEDQCRYKQGDEDLARLLSGSRLGWKSVSIMGYVEFGERSWEALSRHTSTLEKFDMAKWYHQDGVELRPFFTSFPKLKSFVTLAEKKVDYLKINAIGSIDWIHRDPLSGLLIPWPCEYTLTDLRIKISGIPRPDVTLDHKGRRRRPLAEESYRGEGRMIQHRVYQRLARFVNLEVLWLGSNSYYFEYSSTRLKKIPKRQYECLEMSLESGLDELEGLKRLRVLNISLMATRVGQKEAIWMAEQWPGLRDIHGLASRSARQWFKRKCPRVATPVLSTKE